MENRFSCRRSEGCLRCEDVDGAHTENPHARYCKSCLAHAYILAADHALAYKHKGPEKSWDDEDQKECTDGSFRSETQSIVCQRGKNPEWYGSEPYQVKDQTKPAISAKSPGSSPLDQIKAN